MNARRLLPSDDTDDSSHFRIAVRAYVPPPHAEQDPPKSKRRGQVAPPSPWTLVFDTETTTDAAQKLRAGSYQLRHGIELIEAGIFYDPLALAPDEVKLLRLVCDERRLRQRVLADFIEEVFFRQGYDFRASFVGFNLPFDLSRLAIKKPSAARGKTMRGGFSFTLSPYYWRPRVQVRHLNGRASLMQFAHPPKRRDARGWRKRELEAQQRRGSFIDLKTIAAALTSRSFSLASLADFLKTDARKLDVDEHGGPLTREYLDYLVRDVEVTWQCYQVLRDKYELHELVDTHIAKVLSEASLGKAYLKQMGVVPFRIVQPDFPDAVMGMIMSAYYGGRSEVRWRRTIKQVLYCDFLSMYPTVCTLMGLWRFVISQGMTATESTASTRELLSRISLDDLQQQDTWKLLTTIVKIKPDWDALPVRAKYDGQSFTIGVNLPTGDVTLCYTLADVIASKILCGKTPEILEAMTFSPKDAQTDLHSIKIAGNKAYGIDPKVDDFFKRLIDLRSHVRAKMKRTDGAARHVLDTEQGALKILANSTSYGIFVEMIVAEADNYEKRVAYGPSGQGFEIETNKAEEPGRYFYPLLATLITGAARLMLAMSERLTLNEGLDWAFCDTDSMAIAKPDSMENTEFMEKSPKINNWFEPLNPYKIKGSIFKVEDANFGISENSHPPKLQPLYCLCISSKRYALFNIGPSGEIIIRKASAHGLGHLRAPYRADDAPSSIPAPATALEDIGVERWQYDLWHQIIRAELDGHRDQVDLDYHVALDRPAASRYSATTPALLRWFKSYNCKRPYADQVKPFNFLIAFHARPQLELPGDEQFELGKRGRKRKLTHAKPVAPYDKDIAKAAQHAFDRDTGRATPPETLLSYREALAQYHLRPESKFSNGDFADRGRTERRHVQVAGIVHVGKEANKWEQQFFIGPDEEAEIEYGEAIAHDLLLKRLEVLCSEFGEREAGRQLGISRTAIRRALAGYKLSRKTRAKLVSQSWDLSPSFARRSNSSAG
jgi:hypothetical protein